MPKDEFFGKLSEDEGVCFKFEDKTMHLYLVYDKEKFAELISEKASLSANFREDLVDLISLASDWDDFWMAYQYIGLEYERLKMYGFSYIHAFIDKLKEYLSKELQSLSSMEDFLKVANKYATKFLAEDLKMPFSNGRSNFIYFRDLVLLILVFYKKKQLRNKYFIIPTYLSFRDKYPNITTNYGTHKIHYYPAAFIPQVVRFVLNKYTKHGDVVLDMFAGGGTVGVESYVLNRQSVLLDINPLLGEIVDIKTFNANLNIDRLNKDVQSILSKSKYVFIPKWGNISHWYNDEILNLLCTMWGNFYNMELNYSLIIKFALLYISRLFSFADDNVPKLYKSKEKTRKIEQLVQSGNWEELIRVKFIDRVNFIYKAIKEMSVYLKGKDVEKPIAISADSFSYDLNRLPCDIDCIITSPPYLQAQEYIRSIKLDLYWSGFDDSYVRALSKLEIPYRKLPEDYNLDLDLIGDIKKDINFDVLEAKDKNLFDSYFFFTLTTIYRYTTRLKTGGKLCIFVGNPSFKGHMISLWEIFMEFFLERGFVVEGVFADRIVSKKLPNKRNNNNPNGIEHEFLIVFKKV